MLRAGAQRLRSDLVVLCSEEPENLSSFLLTVEISLQMIPMYEYHSYRSLFIRLHLAFILFHSLYP